MIEYTQKQFLGNLRVGLFLDSQILAYNFAAVNQMDKPEAMIRITQKTAMSISAGTVVVAGMCIFLVDATDSFESRRLGTGEDSTEDIYMPEEAGYMKALLQMSSRERGNVPSGPPDTLSASGIGGMPLKSSRLPLK